MTQEPPTTTVDTRAYKRQRRAERRVMVLSTVVGTLGLIGALGAALLDLLRYNQAAPCAAYAAAHKGLVGFGCSASAKQTAIALPAVGIPLLVLLGLAVAWIPRRTTRARAGYLGGLVVVLLGVAAIVYGCYSSLPQA